MKKVFTYLLLFVGVFSYSQTYEITDKLIHEAEQAEGNEYWSMAAELFISAAESEEKNSNPRITILNKTLESARDLYTQTNNPSVSLTIQEKILASYEKTKDFESQKYINDLLIIASLYATNGDYENSINYYNKVKNKLEKIINKTDDKYISVLRSLAEIYKEIASYEIATSLYLEVLENTKNKEKNEYYFIHIQDNKNIGICYLGIGLYKNAIKYYNEALQVTKDVFGEDFRYRNLKLEIANLYKLNEEHDVSKKIFIEVAYEILNKDNVTVHDKMKVCSLYREAGEFYKAEKLYLEILEDTKKYQISSQILNDLALLYFDTKDYENALKYFLIIKNERNEDFNSNSEYLLNMAEAYQNLGYYGEALSLLSEAYKNTNQDEWSYSKVLKSLIDYNSLVRNYEYTILYSLEYLNYVEKTHGKNDLYHNLLIYIIDLYRLNKEYDKAFEFYLKSVELDKNKIQKSFEFLSEKEKEKYIERLENNFKTYYRTFVAYYDKENDVSKHYYNLELSIKGLILLSSLETKKNIENSNDKEIIEIYEKWLLKKHIIGNQNTLSKNKQNTLVNQWIEESEELEKQLIQRINYFKEVFKLNEVTYDQIQNNLKQNEVAIEFSSFQYRDNNDWTDQIRYVALVLRKNDTSPQLIPLFEQNELDKILSFSGDEKTTINQIYRGSKVQSVKQNLAKLYNLIWKPLEEYLKEGQTVYFAPSGTLHQIAFSAVKNKDGKFLSDVYDLKQVSTTAKILHQNERKDLNNITLFGGIDYEVGEWSYLQGTLSEVENIKNLAETSKIKTSYFSGKTASEESFKSLNGNNSPDILHIATHGFFYPDIEKKHTENEILIEQESNVFKSNENPLFRSGLLFSGANKSWSGEVFSSNQEDGILTAYEVSHTSLPNTELVVLSACETGLGDIKGSEGVFGLQRAFKSAGANYLLMSLWKVPDKETAEFMEEFYKNLFQTKDIETSFSKTQNFMKAKYPENPYSWAAFVLTR